MNFGTKRVLATILSLISFSGCAKVSLYDSIDTESRTKAAAYQQDLAQMLQSTELQSEYKKIRENDLRFATSISGGGYRASSFAFGYLLALDSIKAYDKRTLLDELDFVSSVSGGGLSVGAYIAARLDQSRCDTHSNSGRMAILFADSDRYRLDLLRKAWAWNYTKNFFNPKLLSSLNRTDLFRETYVRKLVSKRDCETGFPTEREYTYEEIEANRDIIPQHVANATVSTSGHILPFTRRILDNLDVSCYSTSDGWIAIDSPNMLPYSIGIAASASFPPFLTDLRLGIAGGVKGKNSCDDIKYVHMTDGGQTDDNGYLTALKYVSQSRETSANSQSTLFIAVDALDAPDAISVSQSQTAGFVTVLKNRNMNLPRYALKRFFRNDFFESDESVRALMDGASKGGAVYVNHVNMLYPFYENSVHSTIDTGWGISVEQQAATIREGYAQTVRTQLFSREQHKNQDILPDVVSDNIEKLVNNVLCGGRLKSFDCQNLVGVDSSAAYLETIDKIQSDLMDIFEETKIKGNEKSLLTISADFKNSMMTNALVDVASTHDKQASAINTALLQDISEINSERNDGKLGAVTAENTRLDTATQTVIDNVFALFKKRTTEQLYSAYNHFKLAYENLSVKSESSSLHSLNTDIELNYSANADLIPWETSIESYIKEISDLGEVKARIKEASVRIASGGYLSDKEKDTEFGRWLGELVNAKILLEGVFAKLANGNERILYKKAINQIGIVLDTAKSIKEHSQSEVGFDLLPSEIARKNILSLLHKEYGNVEYLKLIGKSFVFSGSDEEAFGKIVSYLSSELTLVDELGTGKLELERLKKSLEGMTVGKCITCVADKYGHCVKNIEKSFGKYLFVKPVNDSCVAVDKEVLANSRALSREFHDMEKEFGKILTNGFNISNSFEKFSELYRKSECFLIAEKNRVIGEKNKVNVDIFQRLIDDTELLNQDYCGDFFLTEKQKKEDKKIVNSYIGHLYYKVFTEVKRLGNENIRNIDNLCENIGHKYRKVESVRNEYVLGKSLILSPTQYQEYSEYYVNMAMRNTLCQSIPQVKNYNEGKRKGEDAYVTQASIELWEKEYDLMRAKNKIAQDDLLKFINNFDLKSDRKIKNKRKLASFLTVWSNDEAQKVIEQIQDELDLVEDPSRSRSELEIYLLSNCDNISLKYSLVEQSDLRVAAALAEACRSSLPGYVASGDFEICNPTGDLTGLCSFGENRAELISLVGGLPQLEKRELKSLNELLKDILWVNSE